MSGVTLDEIVNETFDSAFNATGDALPIAGVRRDADTTPVSADGDAHPLVFDDAGRLKVATLVSVEPSDAEYAEDSAHTTGDVGLHMLSVRQDTLASSTSADGDYASLKVDSLGQLYTRADLQSAIADDDADSGNPIKIGGRGVDGLLTALSASDDRYDLLGDMYRRTWVNTSANVGMQNSQDDVTGTAAEVLATPLAGRRFVTIQNEGSQDVYMGHNASVTAVNGVRIPKRASATYELGEDINIFMISASGTQDVRFLEAG